jgi:hypothetical protein
MDDQLAELVDELDGLAGLEPTTWFEVLADDHRRTALAVLGERDGPVGLDALARAVAARVATESTDERPTATRRIAITLHHHHLPKLAAAGLVEYDATTRTVTIGAARAAGTLE